MVSTQSFLVSRGQKIARESILVVKLWWISKYNDYETSANGEKVKRFAYKLHLKRDSLEAWKFFKVENSGLRLITSRYKSFKFIKIQQQQKTKTKNNKMMMNGYAKISTTISLKPYLSCSRILPELRIDEMCSKNTQFSSRKVRKDGGRWIWDFQMVIANTATREGRKEQIHQKVNLKSYALKHTLYPTHFQFQGSMEYG